MELVTNTFNKGLLIDTHPMVLGNDSLTDCLNGTIITMNGNELILQNDMGNRRVDNAFLPPGYLPIGIKEYGGIIYVVAYNPITDKSQIGSFPSPLRKFDNLSDLDLGNSFDFDSFLSSDNIIEDSYLEVDVMKSDSFLIPLTKDTSLHAGDKFTIYGDLNNYSQYITNWNNVGNWEKVRFTLYNSYLGTKKRVYYVDNLEVTQLEYENSISSNKTIDYYIKIIDNHTKAYSPKNKQYTILAGILNSQNEFVDITKTLCRWESYLDNGTTKYRPIVYDSSYSDIYKFNDKYFIPESFSSISDVGTEDDRQLILKRLKEAVNTYSYKLIGPLYLKINYNHILEFDYNIYGVNNGITNEGNSYTVWIEGYITYNCPDGISDISSSGGNELYISFEEGTPNFLGFDLLCKNDSTYNLKGVSSPPIYSLCIYNPTSNTYSTKIIKEYNFNNIEEDTIEFVMGVIAGKDSNNNSVYLRELSSKGILDFSKLGSGSIEVSEWRFKNDITNKNTTLTYYLESYPKYGEIFSNLRFVFHNILHENNTNDITYPDASVDGLKVFNGKTTIGFNWNNLLESNLVYKVSIKYDSSMEENNPLTLNESDRWFITTELFNEFYYPIIEGVEDYCKVVTDSSLTGYVESFANKMKVLLEVEDTYNGNNNISSKVVSSSGDLFSKKSEGTILASEFTMTNKYNISIRSNPTVKIKNLELYPNFIDVNCEASLNGYKYIYNELEYNPINNLSDLKNILKSDISININTSGGNLGNLDLSSSDFFDFNLNYSGNTILGSISCYDRFKGLPTSSNLIGELENVFDSLYNNLDDMLPNSNHYIGVTPAIPYAYDYSLEFNFGGIKVLKCNFPLSNNIRNTLCTFIVLNDNTNGLLYSFNSYKSSIFKYFSKYAKNNLVFTYFIPPGYKDSFENFYQYSANNTISPNPYPKIWWKTSNANEWALIGKTFNDISTLLSVSPPSFLSWKEQEKDLILDWTRYNYIYCTYLNYLVDENSPDIYKRYIAKDIHNFNNKYSKNIGIKLLYNSSYINNNILSNLLGINNRIGNLEFISSSSTLSGSNIININLESSLKFLELILEVLVTDVISGLCIVDGSIVDINGNSLNPNYLYYKEIPKDYWEDNTTFHKYYAKNNTEYNSITYKKIGSTYSIYNNSNDNDDPDNPRTINFPEGLHVLKNSCYKVDFSQEKGLLLYDGNNSEYCGLELIQYDGVARCNLSYNRINVALDSNIDKSGDYTISKELYWYRI